MMNCHRTTLHDWSLLYLFSYDVELRLDRQNLGTFPAGVRINLATRPKLSNVYHVARNDTIAGLGANAVVGSLDWGGDELLLREDDVAYSDIRASLKTDDGATIHMWYTVMGYLGPGGVRRVISATGKDQLGTENEPFRAPLVNSPRFQTAHPLYRWMNEHQAIGFGEVEIIRSKFRRLTVDVYVLT
jgi:hypothetical protein